jgi:hypothetical protein
MKILQADLDLVSKLFAASCHGSQVTDGSLNTLLGMEPTMGFVHGFAIYCKFTVLVLTNTLNLYFSVVHEGKV